MNPDIPLDAEHYEGEYRYNPDGSTDIFRNGEFVQLSPPMSFGMTMADLATEVVNLRSEVDRLKDAYRVIEEINRALARERVREIVAKFTKEKLS